MMYMGPVYTVNVSLQCRWVRLYVKTELPYYTIFVKILAISLECMKALYWQLLSSTDDRNI